MAESVFGKPVDNDVKEIGEQISALNSKFAFQSVRIQDGLVAYVTENFVELNFNVATAQGITVQGGSYAYVGYVPSNLRPYGNHAPNGIATNDGASIGVVGIQSSDGRIFIRSKETATFTSFSLVYMYG